MIEKIQAAFENFIHKGQIFPSSKYLVHKMISKINYDRDIKILQLGFGTGIFSIEMLEKMSPKSQLVVFEIRKECKQYYDKIQDDRLIYIEDSAENIEKYFANETFDYILSTLPFANLSEPVKNNIYIQIKKHLDVRGKYLQYQYSLHSKNDITNLFSKTPKIYFTLFNLPPAFIYESENTSLGQPKFYGKG